MASWREIEHIRKSVSDARSIATRLLKFNSRDLTEWEEPFLESIRRHGQDELTTRQSEKLLEIRDGVEFISECRGFSVNSLIEGVYRARADLDEVGEEWIERVRARSASSVARKDVPRLMRIARQLNVVEQESA